MGKKRKEKRLSPLENPSIPLSSASIVSYLGGGGRSLAGVDVNEETSLRLMAVWRAVHLIAGTVAGLPLKVFRDMNGRRTEITDDVMLFKDPMYPDLTWFEGIEALVTAVILWGNAYALKIYNEAGTAVVRLLPLHPGTVTVTRDTPTADNPSGKRYKLQGLEEKLTPFEVMQIPGLSYDGLKGLSPIEFARQAIGVGIAAEEVAAKMFDSGLMMAGILQAESDLTDAQAEEAKRRWREKTAGIVRSYEIAVLSSGFKFTPTSIPPEEAQWLETRHFTVEEISRLFGVPPALLFEYGGTGNVEADKLGAQWVRFGLSNLLSRVEDRFSLHLLPRGTFSEFAVDGLLRGDANQQADIWASAIGAGWMTVNEVRALNNLPPIAEPEPEPESEPEEVEEQDESGDEDSSPDESDPDGEAE